MPIRRTLLTLLCSLLLVPATASAQSAGDDQYSDPFGDQEQEQSQPSQEATPAPAPAQPAQPPAPAQPAPAPAPAQAAQLPRTGWDAALPGALGLIFLAAGVALRAHVRRAA
jgi:hypothetical protein